MRGRSLVARLSLHCTVAPNCCCPQVLLPRLLLLLLLLQLLLLLLLYLCVTKLLCSMCRGITALESVLSVVAQVVGCYSIGETDSSSGADDSALEAVGDQPHALHVGEVRRERSDSLVYVAFNLSETEHMGLCWGTGGDGVSVGKETITPCCPMNRTTAQKGA
jgi:hypothetical protein